MRRGVRSGNIAPNSSLTQISDEALDEQKHSIRIADEKVALAVQAYDLVDTHIQQLDQYLKKFDEELRRGTLLIVHISRVNNMYRLPCTFIEKENAAASGVPSPSLDGGGKAGRMSESGRGGRKKTRQATAAAAAATEAATTGANPTGMDLELPVDPNEPTYCFCNQVSYGEMVACDNNDCKIEWFHFGCVGLKEQPKGKWYCSDCAVLKNRRKGR
ncbi:PHD finger protein ING1 isoform X3 [Quercus lobata]|nr:PHD finger protein ING1 isoform X3 [Quercus lobata]XP_030975245.1 PHD finger protein ING1 isoform X3 [Quercus lobata]